MTGPDYLPETPELDALVAKATGHPTLSKITAEGTYVRYEDRWTRLDLIPPNAHVFMGVERATTGMGGDAVRWLCTCGQKSQPMGKEHGQRGHTHHARLMRKKENRESNEASPAPEAAAAADQPRRAGQGAEG